MKRFLLILFIALLSLTLTGCSFQELLGKGKGKTTKSSQNEQKQTIAVALDDQDPNRALILRGIEDMAKKEDMEIQVLSAKDTESAQKAQSKNNGKANGQKEQSSSQGNEKKGSSSQEGEKEQSPLKDAKVLIYKGGNKQFIQTALEAKVPVLALDEIPAGVKAAGIILPDPDQLGALMAEPLLAKISEGQVVFLQGDPGNSASLETVAGLKRALNKNPKISVHVISNPAGSEAVAKQSLQEYLQKNPEGVKAIAAQNEKLASQAAEVLKTLQLDKKVLLVGADANLQSLQRMATGSQAADIDTAPYIQGVNAFQWAQKIMKNESLDISESITGDQGEVPAKIIPVKSVTSENLALVQKSYTQAIEAQKEQEAAKEAEQNKGNQKDQKDQQKSNSGDKQEGQSGGESAQQQGNVAVPQGAEKVTERVRTEITREYLDGQGNVIGTEKAANDQVRTVPPEMLLQEMQKAQQGGQQEGQKSEQGGKGDQGGGEGGDQGGKKG